MRAQRRAERPGVQGVDAVQAAADPDHLPAEVLDEHGVVGLGVAQDEDPGAGRHGPGDLPLDQRGLADAGLAEDELAGVGDQPGAQPGQRVQADDLAPQQVPADRRAERRGAGPGDEREQAADLRRGGLVLRCRRSRARPARRRGPSIPRRAAPAPARAGRAAARRGGSWRGRVAAGRALFSVVMTTVLLAASAASGGPARRGRRRAGGWRPTRRPGCRSSGAAGCGRTRRRPRSRRRRGAARRRR